MFVKPKQNSNIGNVHENFEITHSIEWILSLPVFSFIFFVIFSATNDLIFVIIKREVYFFLFRTISS